MSMAVRVLVNAVSARVGGGGTYIVSQMEELSAVEDMSLTVLATGTVAIRLRAACPRARIIALPALPAAIRVLWEQLVLPAWCRRFDVVYMPGNFALLLSSRPQVLTIQNAWYFTDSVRRFRRTHCPLAMRLRLWAEAGLARASIRRAGCAVMVSRAMLAAVEEDLGPVAHAKVIASAAPTLPEPRVDKLASLVQPYALVVAHDDPHKEWDRLIEVFLSHPDLPRLVIAGRASERRQADLRRRIARRAPDRVELLGAVTEPAGLTALYRGAACCVAHARFESFGLTACEALSQGTPVVAADLPAHREACGDGALYYDCEDLEGLVEAIRASSASNAGPVQLERTWEDNARELAGTLRAVAGRTVRSAAADASAPGA